MRIEMTRPRVFQDAGAEVQLDAGQVYDLPAVVAHALVATGAAKPADPPVADLDEDHASPRTRDTKPPEGRPLVPPERKRG